MFVEFTNFFQDLSGHTPQFDIEQRKSGTNLQSVKDGVADNSDDEDYQLQQERRLSLAEESRTFDACQFYGEQTK